MFKKLIDFFFVEEEVDDELEENEEELPVAKTNKQSAASQPQFFEVAQKPMTFIDLEEKTKEEKTSEPTTRPNRPTVNTTQKQRERRKEPEYEFTTLISPMFGSEDEKKPTRAVSAHSAATSNTSKESLLGTIISPIYGKMGYEPAAKPVSVTNKQPQTNLPPLQPLDALLTKDGKETVKTEDAHQFTLFESSEEKTELHDGHTTKVNN